MSKKIDIEKLVALGCLNPEEYINTQEKNLEFRCECGTVFKQAYSVRKSRNGKCKLCNKAKPLKLKSSDLMDCLNPEDYINSQTRNLKFPCSSCGSTYITTMTLRKSNKYSCCRDCTIIQRGLSKKVSTDELTKRGFLNPEDYVNNNTVNLHKKCKDCDNIITICLGKFGRDLLCKECSTKSFQDKTRLAKDELTKRGCLNPEDYVNAHTKNLEFKCTKCNNIITSSISSLGYSDTKLCKECNHTTSAGELEVVEFLKQLTEVQQNRRDLISPLEIDIFLPEFNLAIEFNGEYWHSERYRDKNYHKSKQDMCTQHGISLFTIWSLDWVNNSTLIKSMLLSKLGKLPNRVYARKTQVINIDHSTAKSFYDKNHLQGSVSATTHTALVYDGTIVSVMSFKYDGTNHNLVRFASLINTNVIGGASKLLKNYRNNYCNNIISFSDYMYSDGGLYNTLGFTVDKILPPDYKYFKANKVYHKFGFRHKGMASKLDEYNKNISEHDNMLNNGYLRVYDSGKIRWRLN